MLMNVIKIQIGNKLEKQKRGPLKYQFQALISTSHEKHNAKLLSFNSSFSHEIW